MPSAQTAAEIICAADCYPLHAQTIVGLVLCVVLAMLTRQWRYVPVAALIATASMLAIETAYRSLALGEPPFAYLRWSASSDGFWVGVGITFASHLAVISFLFLLKRLALWAIKSKDSIVLRAAALFVVCAIVSAMAFAAVFATVPTLLPRRVVERTMDAVGASPDRCKPDDASAVAGLPSFRGLDRRTRPLVPRLSDAHAKWPAVYTTQTGGFERLLTRRLAIRVDNPNRHGPHRAVALRLAIDERGDVVAATPTGGPPQFHARAIAIASQWRLVPFERDGRPTPVRLEREIVKIEGPELWSAAPSQFPDFADWDSVVVQLRINDSEHALSLEIRGDGSVTIEGEGAHVALSGRHCAVISRADLEALVAEVRRSDVFAMREFYQSTNGSVVVRVGLDDYIKEVRTSFSDHEEVPDRLWHLVDAILQSVHAERWIRGDRFTAPSLAAERWDFSREDKPNTRLLAGVAARGDPEAVRALIAMGAPVEVKHPAGVTRPPFALVDRRTAIERAADNGQFGTVYELLSAPVAWSHYALNGAHIAALEFGNTEVASKIIARGARVTGRNIQNRTALMAAARSGLPDLVARALNAKPDVDDLDGVPLSALHWAAGADYLKAVDSVRTDRRKVIDLLIAAGAKVDSHGHNGWTPLLSNWMGLEDVTAALIAHGADVNAQDEDGLSPLMTNKSLGSVQRLLKEAQTPTCAIVRARTHSTSRAMTLLPGRSLWKSSDGWPCTPKPVIAGESETTRSNLTRTAAPSTAAHWAGGASRRLRRFRRAR